MPGATNRPVGRRTVVLAATAGAVGAALARPAHATGYGYTDDGSNYVIDTGAQLVFKISKSTGDLTSLVYRGTEYQGYGGQNSHIESGLGASSVSIRQSGSTILVSVTHGTLKHYYAARSGENNVYLWTNKADASVSATRYIVRVKKGAFLNDEPGSYTYAPTTIEASDVFRKADGQTRSKHYSRRRVMDYDHIGWSAGGVGLWMVRSNHEKASGGPLPLPAASPERGRPRPLRDPLLRPEPDRGAALWSPGAVRHRLHGRRGTLLGTVPGHADHAVGRLVAGVGISGRNTAYPYTVGLANAAAQYRGSARASDGFFALSGQTARAPVCWPHRAGRSWNGCGRGSRWRR